MVSMIAIDTLLSGLLLTNSSETYDRMRRSIQATTKDHQARQAFQICKSQEHAEQRPDQHKSSCATNSHTRNTSMQEAHKRHCPQMSTASSPSFSSGEGGRPATKLRKLHDSSQKNVDSYEEDDADEHHPCL